MALTGQGGIYCMVSGVDQLSVIKGSRRNGKVKELAHVGDGKC
jgi:hypothetical protein